MSDKITQAFDLIAGMSVLEAAQLADMLQKKLGITPMAAVASAAPAAAASAAPAEEKNEFKVTLKEAGADKIKVIKALRTVVSTLSLKDAKDMVEGAPAVIAPSIAKDDAKKIKEALEAAGAKVELA
jgi:large subunit ribosomal protein L7/L12